MKLEFHKLALLPLFNGIREEDLSAMLACLGSFQKNYSRDEIILLESNEVRSVAVILSGKVHMIKEDVEGYQTLLVTMKEDELFGESFSCGSHLSAQVSFRAATDCAVLFLPFYKIIHSCKMSCPFHHRLIENMVKLIGDKNVQLMQKIEVISKKTLREKILAYLRSQSPEDSSRRFTIPLGRIVSLNTLFKGEGNMATFSISEAISERRLSVSFSRSYLGFEGFILSKSYRFAERTSTECSLKA